MEPTPSSACAAVADSAPARSSNGSEDESSVAAWGPPALLGLVVLVLLAGLGLVSCGTSSVDTTAYAVEPNATVVRVVDGDTIIIKSEGEQERVRLIGINTPESVDPSRPVMCFGKEASAHTKELLKAGTSVRLQRDVEARDRYERLLAYVYRASDGLFVNLDLVRGGYANQYRFPPNTAHEAQFSQAASQAKKAGLGAWAACAKPFEE